MPGEVTWTVEGLFAFIDANPDSVRRNIFQRIMRASQKQAILEWSTRSGDLSLADIFRPSSITTRALTARTPGYQKRQINILRRVMPYASPTRQSGTLRREVLAGGYRITARNKTAEVESTDYISGARQLNRIRAPYGQIYRQEFLGWDGGGRKDKVAITARSLLIAVPAIIKEMESYGKHKMRSA